MHRNTGNITKAQSMFTYFTVYKQAFSNLMAIRQICNRHNICSTPVTADVATPGVTDWHHVPMQLQFYKMSFFLTKEQDEMTPFTFQISKTSTSYHTSQNSQPQKPENTSYKERLKELVLFSLIGPFCDSISKCFWFGLGKNSLHLLLATIPLKMEMQRHLLIP